HPPAHGVIRPTPRFPRYPQPSLRDVRGGVPLAAGAAGGGRMPAGPGRGLDQAGHWCAGRACRHPRSRSGARLRQRARRARPGGARAAVMTVHLFAGPTLPWAEIATLCDFVCLPPVAQGDVFRSVKARPQAIGIVDGYFDGVPAVWHKEILWAMTQGIHVFGSASMGALRAAELHQFGMRGVGRIFEAYLGGELEDDDEVAVTHGPAATGYVSLSEPMVNIRATLESAARAGIVTEATQALLVEHGKGLFYQERSWERLLGVGGADSHGGEMRALRDWLPTSRIDQKRIDGRQM